MTRAAAFALRLLPLVARCGARLAVFAPAMIVALFSLAMLGFALAQANMALLHALAGRPVLGRVIEPHEEWVTFASMGVCATVGAVVMLRWWWDDLRQSDESVRALCEALEERRAAP